MKEKKTKERRQPTLTESVLPLLAMFVILLIGRGILHFSIEAMLLVSATVAAIIAYRVGLTWDEMIQGVSDKIAKALPAILILVVVGIVVSTWMLSGTIPMLIYYGIAIITPKFFMLQRLLHAWFCLHLPALRGVRLQQLVLC